ncbi:MAG: type VI secretion system protein TssA [Gammaproteobacteria bacterium]|nr:type VI secretion system protein TssA [Gammaproteobacteria bacterium]
MPSAETIDFERLLAPVAGDSSVGADLRESDAVKFYALRDACKVARRIESQIPEVVEEVGEDGQVISPLPNIPDATAEWREIFAAAEEILAGESKDIEVVAWLIEALARLQGFAGLRDGFRLARELLQAFGNECFPRGDNPDQVDVYPLKGLNGDGGEGVLLTPIRNIPITQGASVGPFATWHYLSASAGTVALSLDDIALAVAESDRAALGDLAHDLTQAGDEFAALSACVDELCGADAMPNSHIRNQLTSCGDALKFLGIEVMADAIAPEPQESSDGPRDADKGPSAAANPPRGNVSDREEAFRTIAELADFFRRTEPHSPVSYALDRVVRWGRMPLPQLLQELIKEDPVREAYFQLTGIGGGASNRPGADESSADTEE